MALNTEGLRFTIAISSYNIEKYIKRAIDSVLNQEFTNYEIIIVDDCSTDNTVEKIKQCQNEKIRFFENEKQYSTF